MGFRVRGSGFRVFSLASLPASTLNMAKQKIQDKKIQEDMFGDDASTKAPSTAATSISAGSSQLTTSGLAALERSQPHAFEVARNAAGATPVPSGISRHVVGVRCPVVCQAYGQCPQQAGQAKVAARTEKQQAAQHAPRQGGGRGGVAMQLF